MDTGSFASILGPEAAQALQEAIGRRQQGGNMPVMNQTTPASPMGQTPEQTGQVQGGAPMPSPQMAPEQIVGQPPQGMPVGNPEAEIILKALSDRLKTISKLETGG